MSAKYSRLMLVLLWLQAFGCCSLSGEQDPDPETDGSDLGAGDTAPTSPALPDSLPTPSIEESTQDSFVFLESAGARICGLTENKTIRCWSDRWVSRPSPDGQFESMGSGNLNSCGLRSNGSIGCPRRGLSPRLRKAVPTGGPFTHLTGTIGFGCALRLDGTVLCWGDESSPRTLQGHFKSIEAVNDFVCGLTLEGQVSCSSRSKYRDLALEDGPFVQIGVEHRGVCGLREDGSVSCSKAIEMGDSPVTGIKSITRSGSSICGIDNEGMIHCWGYLGRSDPMPPPGIYLAAAPGFGRFCAILADRTVQCWGERHGFETGVPSVQTPEHILVKNVTSKADVTLGDVRGLEVRFEHKIEGGSKRIDYFVTGRLRDEDGSIVPSRTKARLYADGKRMVRVKTALDAKSIGRWAEAEVFFPYFALDLEPGAREATVILEGHYQLDLKGRPRLVKLVGFEPLSVSFEQPTYKTISLRVNRIEVAKGNYDFSFGPSSTKRLPDLAWSLGYTARYHAEVFRSTTARDTCSTTWSEAPRPFVHSAGDRLSLTVLDEDVASPDRIGHFTFTLEELQAAANAGQPLKQGKVISLELGPISVQ